MKGNISLKDFIKQVSKELREGQITDQEKAFFELTSVSLEVSFSLDTTAKGSGKFVVVELGAETKASQMHKVTLQLDPIKRAKASPTPDPQLTPIGPQYAPPVHFPQNGPMYDSPGILGPSGDLQAPPGPNQGSPDLGPGII